MTIPDHVRIGAVTYTVKQVDRLTDDGASILGMIRYKTATIEIDAGMPDAVRLVTFWHEVVHGICHHAGVKHSEGVVQALSYGLVDLFERNGWTLIMEAANAVDA